MGKNHLSANAMQGGRAEPQKGKIVDEFVVQLIADAGKKKMSAEKQCEECLWNVQ